MFVRCRVGGRFWEGPLWEAPLYMYMLSQMLRSHTLFLVYETLKCKNVYIKTKVLFKFGSLKIVCVKMRPKNPFKLPLNRYL